MSKESGLRIRALITVVGVVALMAPLVFRNAALRTASAQHAGRSGSAGLNNPLTSTSLPDEPGRRTLSEAFGKLPLSFEANRGQTDSRVKFLSRGAGYTLFLTSTEAVLSLQRGRKADGANEAQTVKDSLATEDVLRLRFSGANQHPKVEGVDQLTARSNYFIGSNPARWHLNVPNYGGVRYQNVYPGIDLVYYGNQHQLENDFIVAPGANPRAIKLSFAGAESVAISQEGKLLLKTPGGEVELDKPVAYQKVDGVRREVNVKYEFLAIGKRQTEVGNDSVGFDVSTYDPTKPLVIDPVLLYSTYLGGSSSDSGSGIALDPSGNAYVAGYTSSSNFPLVNSIQAYPGNVSGFVSKINASGTALIYSTYLGGTGNGNSTNLFDIAVDSAGNAYATGLTFAADYPTTANALQQTKPVNTTQNTGVVTRLNPSGTLAYSTYLGSTQASRAFGIATDGAGNAYVAGSPGTGFPTTASAFNSTQPTTGFLTRLDTNASGQASLVYSTFLGPAFGASTPTTIAVDASGNAYLAGNASAGSNNTGFTTAGAFQTTYGGGGRDVFVAKFNTNASGNASRIYCTYLGGSGDDFFGEFTIDSSKAIAIDAGGNAYVTARTASTNFPVLNAFQGTKGGTTTNAFLTKLNPTGSALVYSTYFGGNNTTTPGDGGLGLAVNVVGNAYVTGFASSADFPTSNPIVPVQATGGVFVAKFTPSGNGLVYSTRLSGPGEQHYGHGIALDGAGNAFVTGNVRAGFPTTLGAFQTSNGGLDDAFVSQIADPTIIGRVVDENGAPISAATVNLSGVPSATTTTDANGYFTFGLLTVGGSYTVSVSVPNYIFNSQTVNNLQKNVRLDFSPVVQTISGQVTLGSGGLAAVTMTLTGGKSLSTQTDAGGNYSFANLPAGRDYTITPAKPAFGFLPTSRSFTNLLANQTANFVASATIQFNVGSYVANEADGKATITITRTSGASGPASVRYSISDGTAKQKSDYILAFGTLRMAAGETSRSFQVLIVDDDYVEGDEFFFVTLSDPVGATIGTPNPAMVTITDNDTAPPTSNPIDQSRFFVQQHYYDFLSRYPDQAGWDFWTNQITNCGANQGCIDASRVSVSASFFLSIEFQQTGYLVERIHKSAYGDATGTSTLGGIHQLSVPIVRFSDFISDTEEIGDGVVVLQPGWEALLENNKQAFSLDFIQRSRFTTAFPTSMTPAQFVDKLNQNAGGVLSASERTTAINLFGSATDTSNITARAQALRQVAEDPDLQAAEFNHAFVLMQYFGYLRRNPNDPQDSDYTGYDFWLTKLNQFGGNYINAEMVKAFITSVEYRSRFGPATVTPTPTPTPTPTSTPTPTPGQGLTPEQRVAVLKMVNARFESLSNSNLDRSTVNQELLNFIRSRPEFADAGISTDSCVWARYTDGVELIAINNLDPPGIGAAVSEPPVARTAHPNIKPENVPDSEKARLLRGLGPAFYDDPIPDIRAWLYEQNYSEAISQGATVAGLKTVGGDGVFFLNAHGGLLNGKFVVTTAELESLDLEKENPQGTGSYDDDLKNGRLVYASALWSVDQATKVQKNEATYGITSGFIRKYWGNFAPDSFVFISACSSASPEASDFDNAIKEKKASVYAGWTTLSSIGPKTTRFVFDRLLGANKVYPESDGFKQRPFDYQSVAQDAQYHGVAVDPFYGGELVFAKSPGPSKDGFQLLAPSIKELQVDELSNTLVLLGIFGDDPGPSNGAVFVDGQQLHVQNQGWTRTYIACDLPKSGAGSAGGVIVTVHQHKSNVAYLSEWQGTFTHTVTGSGSTNSTKQTSTYKVTLRADIRKVRESIHAVPTFGLFRIIGVTEDSTETYECFGAYPYPDGETTEVWSGAGTLHRLKDPPELTGAFNIDGAINDDGKLYLVFTAGPGRIVTFIFKDGRPPYSLPYDLLNPIPDEPSGRIYFDLDANGNITGNTLDRIDPNDGKVHKLTWDLMTNKYPPGADSPR